MIRVAVRALILDPQGRLLIVNAWPGGVSDLWTAPGGGADPHMSLPGNLIREVHEETGLTIEVGAPAMVNEFHDPHGSFHQVDVYFRCRVTAGELSEDWRDPEGVVVHRRWVSREELASLRVKPDSLARAAWDGGMIYDPLEPIIR
ncbi:NUDIX domain-containing protein [Falsirhodobacter algicola]|uniref:NUDIX domain-containing protein n=1 Tax=Falsirhodobacter algicola TaxID=2692330 RepID=A0A8J8SKV0_9RHOB|nr:NUDIX hydrolase [Falsirhodobacter algicola]QUS35758.1 NUDIX domain-containing protein [Falsirhodobacter algicola]